MRNKDLHLLPKIRDSWSYLYVEHCRVDQEDRAIAIHDKGGKTPVPCAMLALLMLGPGTSITQAAIRTLADCGCLVMWCGEESVRFYAVGIGETRSARNLYAQAHVWAHAETRRAVVHRMYRMRFREEVSPDLDIQELRGREGVRVQNAYRTASRETGVAWNGRSYKSSSWRSADPVNRAISCANSCLYGLCHAAVVSAGFSPALGFIHTGKMLSFVYDIADLYKADVTIPLAFHAVQESDAALEVRVRKACRDAFFESRLLERIIPDIREVLGVGEESADSGAPTLDEDESIPGGLWDPLAGTVAGGANYAEQPERKSPSSEMPEPESRFGRSKW